ncbi:calcium-binding and coiled-coil domain-containing protein 2-like, partial [Stegodyphus dumicola]|uniref:calcium-binding and coiled-coil domain-containing protein 2-like n=1 Tax=Stegodyphus dumicola TaxID=202533 RepID=UPI0015B2FCE3
MESNCKSIHDDRSGVSWHDLSKSDYAKVIFCDLYNLHRNKVGCRFQITDNVHEDPCDYIGLFRVGYDNISQCLIFKLLSETKCEEDGKQLCCEFKWDELPKLEHGFYQFVYITCDKEICGASMPFEIRGSDAQNDSSDEDIVAENVEDDYILVKSNAKEKVTLLLSLLDEYRVKNLTLSSELEKCTEEKAKLMKEHEVSLL